MAKGKGDIKGWITRHGVHIPIYDNYSVRGGEEPKAKGSKFKKKHPRDLYGTTIKAKGKDGKNVTVEFQRGAPYFKNKLRQLDENDPAYQDVKDYLEYMGHTQGENGRWNYKENPEYMRDMDNVRRKAGEGKGKQSKNAATEGESDASKGKQVEGKGAVKDVEGARTTKLTEEQSAKLHSMAEEYVGSTPVSGSWDTETEHLQNRIAKEFGVSKDGAKQIMKNKLGYDDDMFKSSAKDEVAKKEDKYANRDWNKEIGDARDKGFSKAAKEADAIKYDFDDPNSFSPDTEVDGERLGDIMSKKLYNEPGKNIKNNLAKIKEQNSAKNLTSEQNDKVMDIANRYNTSQPVSGSWKTEAEHERQAIAKELGISSNKAKAVMKDRLGFDDSNFKNEQAPRFKNANFGKEQESPIPKSLRDASDSELTRLVNTAKAQGDVNMGLAVRNEMTARRKESSTISAEDHKQATNYLKSNLKAALPTSVSGLKQAYADATGEEKSAIRAELRKKGYTYVGGKWVKGK